ncbi:sugar kinase [Ferrimonas senticii]|uniref:sugar kinase n=1 Tax=Ferrimonas senticii TaxID=394566 RepID=UPI000483CA3A|nr:sugar kinase [Ferrimonas senticii]
MLHLNSKSPQRVALIGECMIELSQAESGLLRQGFGGDTLNTAVYLARLTNPQQVACHYVTALGTDRFSEQMLSQWRAEGIDCSYVLQLPHKLPGLYNINVDQEGERSFYYWRENSAARELLCCQGSEQLLAQLQQFDLLYLSGISVAILDDGSRERLYQALADARSRGAQVVFDSNYRPTLWQSVAQTKQHYQRLLSHCDIALLTFEDEQLLYADDTPESVFSRYHGLGVSEVVLKRGAADCLISDGHSVAAVAARRVAKVVDTTSAGDSFNAGYLAVRLAGGSAVEAAHYAHQVAAAVIQYPGALIPTEALPAPFAR